MGRSQLSHRLKVGPLFDPAVASPKRLFCSVTGSRGSDAPEMNIDQSRSGGDVSGTTSDRLIQAEAQTRACVFTIAETSLA